MAVKPLFVILFVWSGPISGAGPEVNTIQHAAVVQEIGALVPSRPGDDVLGGAYGLRKVLINCLANHSSKII